MKSYVLATPALDELENLPGLLADLEGQELPPALWLVVDDGSTDGTLEWLLDAAESRDWMVVHRSPEVSTEYLGGHVARIKRWGIEQALELVRERGGDPFAAGVVDADLRLPKEHYRRLVDELARTEQMGIVSSVVRAEGEGNRKEAFQRTDLPRGGTQTFRVRCLEEIGGIPPYAGFDGASNVKAKLAGWETRLITDLVATHARPTATRFGVGPGYIRKGKYAWFLGLHPVVVAGRGLAFTLRSPHSGGYWFLRGWVLSALRGTERCPDPEVREYYGKERLREYLRVLRGKGPSFARRD